MSHRIVDVWKLIWPNGIAEADYEPAYRMLELVEDLQKAKPVKAKRATRKFKPRIVASEGFFTTDQVAKNLGVSKETVYAIIRKGAIHATHKGKDRRSGLLISKESLEQYKKSKVA